MKTALLFAFAVMGANALLASGPDYTLHEWGTFTSVSASDGTLLPGLQQEEEPLPLFVYSHDGMSSIGQFNKGFRRPLENVTIKMETPVMYFYTQEPFSAHVSVGFNGGSISQWFPQRSGGEVPPKLVVKDNQLVAGGIDFGHGYKGSIEWNVRVAPPSPEDGAAVFKPWETLTWDYPRQSDSALITTPDGSAEKFIFYRGLGNFPLPVKFSFDSAGKLDVRNTSDLPLVSVFIFNHPGYDDKVGAELLTEKGSDSFGPLKSGGMRSLNLPEPLVSKSWRHDVYMTMRGELVKAGLYPREADSMMQTWWKSYFEKPGVRAFWIVPQEITGQILPLNVQPAPKHIVRVLVGRSELLTPEFEKNLVKDFASADPNPYAGDRYYPAYNSRVKALNSSQK